MVSLMKSEFEFFDFFEMTPDLVCIAGKDGFFKKVNPVVIDKLGYSLEELFARPISSFIYQEDKESTRHNREDLLSGKVLHNFTNRYVSKNGSILWLEWTSIYFPNNEIVFAIAKDITERKLIENETAEQFKKFKNLASFFKNNIEKNRKYLAYQLHEELAQLMFAVKMDIDLIANNSHELSETTRGTVDHALAVSKLTIQTLQRISFSISPGMLDEFGLNVTMDWLCKEFAILNAIPCDFESDCDEAILTSEIKIDLFRICQESLTNVSEHALAKKVKVSIKSVADKIQLTITDDGKGFEMDQEKATPGLNSMKERATSINGALTVFSKPGEGTTVSMILAKENAAKFNPSDEEYPKI